MAADEVARRYTIDELLALQHSPLVRKPDGLPDISEWMPAAPPPNTRNQRTRAEDLANEDGSSGSPSNTRRPTLFDRHMSRSSLTENIILGPPKLSFASANSQLSRKLDGEPATPGTNSLLDDDREQFSPRSFDRFRNNRASAEKNNDREFRPGFGRRGLRGEDGETSWTSTQKQPRRSFGAEDGDRFRRDGDRENPRERGDRTDRNDRNGHRDRERGERDTGKDRPRGFENYNRDRDRDRPPLKKREESSWLLRDNDGRDAKDSRGDRDFSGRDRDRGDRERDNGYGGRFSRVEKDPEWMHTAADDKDDSKPARSIDELQRWKERRKAETAAASGIPQKPSEPEQAKVATEPEQATPGTSTLGVKSPESGVDQFFSMWATTPSVSGTPAADPLAAAGEAARPPAVGRSSRFTSFFGQGQESPISPQKTESPAQTVPLAPAPDRTASATGHVARTSNEDKEGFQRILQMLGGVAKSPSVGSEATSSAPLSTPRPQDPQITLPPPKERYVEPQNQRQRDEPRRTPLSQASPAPSLVPFSQLLDPSRLQSPPNSGQGKDENSEFLMRLMQSSQAQERQERAKQLDLEHQLQQQHILQQQQQQKMLQQEQQQQQLLAEQKRQEWILQQQHQQQQQQQLLAQQQQAQQQQQQQEREREQREIERRRLQQQQLQLQQAQQQAQQAPTAHLAQQFQQLHLAQHSQGPQQNGQGQARPGNQQSQLPNQNLLTSLQQQLQQGPQTQAQLHQHQQALLQQHLHGQGQSQQNLHSLLQQNPNQLPQLQQLQQNRQAGQTQLPSLQQSLQHSNIPSLPNLHTGYGSSSGMPPPPALSASPHQFSRGPPANNPLSPTFEDGPNGNFSRQRPNQDFNLMGREPMNPRELLAREQAAFRENGLGREVGRDAGPQRPGGMEHLPGWASQGLPQHGGPNQQPQQQQLAPQQQQTQQAPHQQQANGAQRGAVPPPPGFTGSQNGPSRPGPGAQNIPSLGNPPFIGHLSQGPSGMPPPPSLPPFQLGHGGPPPNGPNFPPPPFFGMPNGPPPHPNFPLSPFHNDGPVMGMGGPPPFPFPPDVKGLNLPQGMHPPPQNPTSRFFPS